MSYFMVGVLASGNFKPLETVSKAGTDLRF
jgi:hypothetical protein